MTMPSGLGAIIALIVLVVSIVLIATGQISMVVGLSIAFLAIARLT